MTSFRGSFTVMVTPFTADGRLDEAGLARFVDWQIREGVHGLIPLGSTGEFLSLTRAERRRVGEIVVETAAGPFASDAFRAELRRQFLCGPDNPRVKTGTPWPLDAPRPEGHPLGP